MNSDQMKFTAAVALVALWAAFVFTKMAQPDALLDFIKVTLGAIVGHWSGSSQGASRVVPAAVDVKQAGFARPMLLAVIAIVLGVSFLAGCTTTTASIARGYEAQAKAGVQMFDDNQLLVLKDALCWQPYGAVQRHPEVQPAIVSLCGALANATTIDPAQAQRLLDIAKQLNVTATPAAAAASGAK